MNKFTIATILQSDETVKTVVKQLKALCSESVVITLPENPESGLSM